MNEITKMIDEGFESYQNMLDSFNAEFNKVRYSNDMLKGIVILQALYYVTKLALNSAASVAEDNYNSFISNTGEIQNVDIRPLCHMARLSQTILNELLIDLSKYDQDSKPTGGIKFNTEKLNLIMDKVITYLVNPFNYESLGEITNERFLEMIEKDEF